jgi:hypothetical protein
MAIRVPRVFGSISNPSHFLHVSLYPHLKKEGLPAIAEEMDHAALCCRYAFATFNVIRPAIIQQLRFAVGVLTAWR